MFPPPNKLDQITTELNNMKITSLEEQITKEFLLEEIDKVNRLKQFYSEADIANWVQNLGPILISLQALQEEASPEMQEILALAYNEFYDILKAAYKITPEQAAAWRVDQYGTTVAHLAAAIALLFAETNAPKDKELLTARVKDLDWLFFIQFITDEFSKCATEKDVDIYEEFANDEINYVADTAKHTLPEALHAPDVIYQADPNDTSTIEDVLVTIFSHCESNKEVEVANRTATQLVASGAVSRIQEINDLLHIEEGVAPLKKTPSL